MNSKLNWGKYFTPSNLFIISICVIILFITSRSILQPGLPLGHDSFAHATYAKLFINALEEGQFPVRFIEHIWVGFGQPLFDFYQVGFYYFISFVNLLTGNFLFSLKLSVLLIWWIGGLFVYLLTKKYGSIPASLAVIVFVLSPYLVLDIFHRTSFPEVMALCFMPGVFWSLEQLLTSSQKKFIPIFATLFAITIFSHLPTLVIFSPVLLGFMLLTIYTQKVKLKGIIFATIGGLLGIGMGAFYFIPALLEQNFIQINTLQAGFFNFKRHFIKPFLLSSYVWGYGGKWWAQSQIPLMGITQWIIVIAGILALITPKVRAKIPKISFIFWVLVICYSFFFMQRVSEGIWEKVTILGFIQFPWRFFMVIPLSLAIISSQLTATISNYQIKILILALVFLINLITIGPVMAPEVFGMVDYFNLPLKEWKENIKVKEVAFFEPSYSPIGFKSFKKDQFTKIWSVSENEVEVVEQITKNHLHVFKVKAIKPATFTLLTPFFPGWKAYINEKEFPINLLEENSYMSIPIPAGEYILEIRFTNSTTRFIANGISIFSITVTALIFFSSLIYRKKYV